MNMKSFLFRLLVIAICLAFVDIVFGWTNKWMIKEATGGETFCQEYVSHKCNEDIVMFGSSRMRHHYNPMVIADSLGVSCYNAGEDGGGIILNYGLYKMLSKRYTPKMIIYDINWNYDAGGTEDDEKYLGWLRKYYDEPGIDSIVVDVSSIEAVKNISNLYRYNTRCIATLGDYVHPVRTYEQGFSPLYGELNYEPQKSNIQHVSAVNPLKIKYLAKLIKDAKAAGTKVVLFVSPQYDSKADNGIYNSIRKFADKNQIPFFDYYYCPGISGNKKYFRDSSHLNVEGAEKWTNIVVSKLKEITVL